MARRKPAPVLPLPEFEGAPVSGTTFTLVKANDVLRDAAPPESLTIGSDVYVVLRGRITEVAHGEPSPDSDVRVRRHHVVAQEAVFTSEVDAKLLLDAERARRDLAPPEPPPK